MPTGFRVNTVRSVSRNRASRKRVWSRLVTQTPSIGLRGPKPAPSYEARKFGVHSAMPSMTAGRLCPKGMFVRPRMKAYQEESRQIMKLVAETGAVIEQMSIDEAYLDLS